MGCWRTALPIHSPTHVCTCHQMQEERSGEVNSLWLPTRPPKARLQDGHNYHPAGRVPDIQWRNWEPLLSSICAQEVAWTPTVWARKSMRDNRRHVFLERPPKAEKGEQSGGGGELESAGTNPSCHFNWASPGGRCDTSGDQDLLRPGKPIGGPWQPLLHWRNA